MCMPLNYSVNIGLPTFELFKCKKQQEPQQLQERQKRDKKLSLTL